MKAAQISSAISNNIATPASVTINQVVAHCSYGKNLIAISSKTITTAASPTIHQAAAAGVRTGSGNSLTSAKTSRSIFAMACHIAGYSTKNRVNTWFPTRYASSAKRSLPLFSHTSSPSAVSSASSVS